MAELLFVDEKIGADLDEHSISELIRFVLLLDKWDREAKAEGSLPQDPNEELH